MPIDGFKKVTTAACLLSLAVGCRSMGELPDATVAEAAESEYPVRQTSFEPSQDPEEEGLGWSDFAPENVGTTVKRISGFGPDEELASSLYAEGKQLFEQAKYEEAAEKFKAAVKRAPVSLVQENSLFMLGESLFFSDDYPEAEETYAQLLADYDYTHHLDTVIARQFSIGRYWEEIDAAEPGWLTKFQYGDDTRPVFDTWGRAMKAYETVRVHDPTGPLADDSILASANANFFKERYDDAAHLYGLIRSDYPTSDHIIPAHLLEMKCQEEIYQGPMYDGTSLSEAGEIGEQLLLQFGSELGDQRTVVLEATNRIAAKKAERDWAIAQYYDNKKYYGAAQFYYKMMIKEYGTTPIGKSARERLAEIEYLPDKPANHFKWLTNLFPTHSD